VPIDETELQYSNPFELIVAVILSAQCTDKRINQVTPKLFKDFPTAEVMAASNSDTIFSYIRSVSYPNNKAKHLVNMANMLLADFNGIIPSEINELVKLPGVGRKTANVVASVIYNKPAMAVDTHVFRVSNRLGLTKAKTALASEMQLIKHIPKENIATNKYEQFTFKESASAVVSGIALSIVTPNQIGDFAGRVLNLNKLAKLKGALLAVIGYTAQVLTTIVFGLFAYWRLVLSKADLPGLTAILCFFAAILSVFIFFNFQLLSPLLNKFRFLKKYEESINVFKEQKSGLLLNVLILSVVRFCTYLVQFWLLLKFFQVEISAFDAFSAIISTFFVQSFVPSFLLLELGLRGSAAIWFIGMFSSNIPGILLAS
jgi:endonuclease-3